MVQLNPVFHCYLLYMRFSLLVSLVILSFSQAYPQGRDTLVQINDKQISAQIYSLDSQMLVYPKPKAMTFVAFIPKTFKESAKMSFGKKSAKPWVWMVGSTVALWAADQKILDGVQQFSRFIHLDNSRKYKNIIQFKLGNTDVNVYQAPENLNTAIYSVGEGMPSILISAGLLVRGLTKNDYRAMSTASQIMQGTLAMGITTQFLKRITGRQSPYVATQDRGEWHLFPNPKVYMHNVPHYDAFPSGHMGTMMTTTVILADNYPEKKWIRPVGYSVMTVVGLSMINNGVHWASDYPLAIGLGYVFGKATVKLNRWIKNETGKKR